MKRYAILLIVVLLMSVSCTKMTQKIFSRETSYKDPETIGGYWDVTMQTGQTFRHVRCTYWGIEDDTAVFEMDDGRLVCQSGAVVCVYAGDI